MNRRLRFWLAPIIMLAGFIILGQFTDPKPGAPAWEGWTYFWITFASIGLGLAVLGWFLSRRMVRNAQQYNPGNPLRLAEMLQTMSQAMALSFTFKLAAGLMSVGYRNGLFLPTDKFLSITLAGWSIIFIIMGIGGVIATTWYMITEMRYIREHPDDKE